MGELQNKDLRNTKIPWYVYVVAILLAALPLFFFYRAYSLTPEGWQFTGNLSASPDMMQYRYWMRQVVNEGPIVENKFSVEENRPHLIVIYYYLIGKTAQVTKIAPEWIYAFFGSILVFITTLVIYFISSQFMKTRTQAAWVFGIILLGGGFGAHLRILSNKSFVIHNPILYKVIVEPVLNYPVFENFRGNYLFQAFFDSHYMTLWLLFSITLMVLFIALKNFSPIRLILVIFLSGFITLYHIYEGVTFIAILLSIGLLLWIKQKLDRHALILLSASLISVLIAFLVIYILYSRSGAPLPNWRGENILFSILMISYPIAWILIVIGIGTYWMNADLEKIFLLGWAIGCTAILLSGPFYMYPARGSLTLQIPLYIIAGQIYFSRYRRVTPAALVIIVISLLVTPVWIIQNRWESSNFNASIPALFINADHREIIDTLKSKAVDDDILIADLSKLDWKRDLLWLAPEYPGRFFCAHFFLCVDYDQKMRAVSRFYQDPPSAKAAFMQEINPRFVFVGPEQDLIKFQETPGLLMVVSNKAGTLFEYKP
jgi:hypothetical protein